MKKRYSRQGLWSLFLMCMLLLHVWALVLIARDMSWVAERTNGWDAVGVAAYGLMFTLVESILLFVVVSLLGFLTPGSWTTERRVAFLSILVLVASLWALVGQLFFLLGHSLPAGLLSFLASTGHPVRTMYLLAFLIVLPSVLVPALWVARSDNALGTLRELIDRLSLLASFYLFFDLVGIVIVIIRNIR